MIVSEERTAEEVEREVRELTLIPQAGRLILIENKVPEKIGSLYLPQNQKEVIATEGYVIAVGEGCSFCQLGDHVYYGRYAGSVCTWQGREYYIINEVDILGKEKRDANS